MQIVKSVYLQAIAISKFALLQTIYKILISG